MVLVSCSGVEHALLVAAGDEHQRAVELVHLVEEDRDVHRARLGHLVVVHPGAVVLVPLPDVAVEGLLAVDLELVHVDVFAEELPTGSTMRGWRASRANGALYRCAAKLVRTTSPVFSRTFSGRRCA